MSLIFPLFPIVRKLALARHFQEAPLFFDFGDCGKISSSRLPLRGYFLISMIYVFQKNRKVPHRKKRFFFN